jgi:hypothetical protein
MYLLALDKSLKALHSALVTTVISMKLVPEARDGTSGFSAQVSEDMIPVAVHAVKPSASPERAALLYPVS